MTPRSETPARGFTLLELVISVGMTAIVVGAAITLLVNQQRAYQAGAGDRGLQEAAQTALTALGVRIRSAGYGVDPAYALDFGDVDRVPQQGLRPPQKLSYFAGHACASAVRCRDQVHGPPARASDELVLYTRNPMFSRPVVSADENEVKFRGDLSRPILPGQVLMVMCLSGSRARAYVTASAKVDAATPRDPAKELTVLLEPGVLTGGLSTFPFQNDQLTDPCFSDGNAVLARVERHRFYVAWFNDAGAEVAPQTEGARPFLMEDRGLVGESAVPIAQDVEDLQFTYFFPPNAAGGPVRAAGQTIGTNLADDDPKVDVGVPPPALDAKFDDPSRTTGNPANIQAIRVSVVVRTPEPDQTLVSAESRTLPAAANRDAFEGVPGFHRALFEDTFIVPNLRSASVIHCVIGNDPGQNRGGC